MVVEGQGAEGATESGSAIDGYESNSKEGAETDGEDLRGAFRTTKQELSRTKSELDGYRARLESVQKKAEESGEIVSRLRDALSPDSGTKTVDPTIEWQQQLDHYLHAAIQAEKAGRPMPLTTNLGIQFYQSKIDSWKSQNEQTKKINELQDQIKTLTDPNREVDHRAISQIDSTIVDYIERLYGTDEKTFPQRKAQYHAIADQVRSEIASLQKSRPDVWEQIRRSEGKQRKLVEFVVEQNQPPKVRQILEEQRLRDTPLGDDELHNAFREAQERFRKGDRKAEKEMVSLRTEILGRMLTKKKGGSKVSRMYG